MNNLFCALSFHDWTVWSKPNIREVLQPYTPGPTQERNCRECGAHEIRRVIVDE